MVALGYVCAMARIYSPHSLSFRIALINVMLPIDRSLVSIIVTPF